MKKGLYKTAILIGIVFLGYMLFTMPARLIQQYDIAKAHGQVWGYIYLGGICLGLLLMVGASIWIFLVLYKNTQKEKNRQKFSSKPLSQIPDREKLRQISENIQEAKRFAKDTNTPDFQKVLEEASKRIELKLEKEILEIAAFGTVSSGKSSLLNVLAGKQVFDTAVSGGTTNVVRQVEFPGGDRVVLVDTPGLAEADGGQRTDLAKSAAENADLILFVIDGPLKVFEYDAIAALCHMEKRVIVCLNKQDWFSPKDQRFLIDRLKIQLKDLVEPEDIVVVQAAIVKRTIVRVSPQGEEREEIEEIPPDVSQLSNRMYTVIKDQRRKLLLCNLLLQSRALRTDVSRRLRQVLIGRAHKVVESYTWKAAIAAGASPTPVIDLAVGLGFSLKMVLEIAAIFERKIGLADAEELLDKLLKNLCASLGASALAPGVAQVVASGLKGVPGAGTLSGGALQGVVQAVMTRWIGLVMIEYFQSEKETAEKVLKGDAMKKWERLTSPSQLARLAVEGAKRFKKGS